jgi:pyridoxine 4-dehydrogenase
MAADAVAAGTISLAGRTVPRMGFGAMQLRRTADSARGRLSRSAKVRRARVRVIDPAWYYGNDVVNRFIAEALRPYPADLVLETKAGARATSNVHPLRPDYRPEQMRAGNDRDRTVLGLDTIPLTHLRWPDGNDAYEAVTFGSAFDTMLAMQAEGRIEHIGLSNVTLDQLRRAHARGPIASASNMFGYGNQARIRRRWNSAPRTAFLICRSDRSATVRPTRLRPNRGRQPRGHGSRGCSLALPSRW